MYSLDQSLSDKNNDDHFVTLWPHRFHAALQTHPVLPKSVRQSCVRVISIFVLPLENMRRDLFQGQIIYKRTRLFNLRMCDIYRLLAHSDQCILSPLLQYDLDMRLDLFQGQMIFFKKEQV